MNGQGMAQRSIVLVSALFWLPTCTNTSRPDVISPIHGQDVGIPATDVPPSHDAKVDVPIDLGVPLDLGDPPSDVPSLHDVKMDVSIDLGAPSARIADARTHIANSPRLLKPAVRGFTFG